MTIDSCGCCEGIEAITPLPIANRPGLSALTYRIGTQATLLETMLARLSELGIPLKELGIPLNATDNPDALIYPTRGLTTRSTDDPSIAFLDAWAVVLDIFTFYQERIANEGYLLTAVERRSVLQLARLVGYTLRPGVAASVYLAYTLENGQDTLIPKGSRAQSLPGPGELPQAFETSVDLAARSKWNNLQPRMSVPQNITQVRLPFRMTFIDMVTPDGSLYLAGTGTNLKPNDPVLFVFGDETRSYDSIWTGEQVFGHVLKVTPDAAKKITTVSFPATFTPLVFLRSALQLIDQYLDLAAFGVSPNDPGVSDVTTPLTLLKDILELLESFLLLVESRPSLLDPAQLSSTFSDVVTTLALMGVMLLLVESYEDLEQSLVSPFDLTTLTIKDILDSLTHLESILPLVENCIQLIQSGSTASDQPVKDVIAQLQQQQKDLSTFATTVKNLQLKDLLNGVAARIADFVSHIPTTSTSESPFGDVVTDLQDAQQAIQAFLFNASATPVNAKNATAAATLLDLFAVLSSVVGRVFSARILESGASPFSLLRHGISLDQIKIGIFSAWCQDYSNAVQSGSAKVANWIGGLINDTRNLISSVPGGGVLVKNVCVPAVTTSLATLSSPLAKPPSIQPANSARLRRNPKLIFDRKGDIAIQLLATLIPQVGSTFYNALANADVTQQPSLRNFYALRAKAAPFGINAPRQSLTVEDSTPPKPTFTTGQGPDWPLSPLSASNVLDLDARYDQIVPNSWVVIDYASSSNKFPWLSPLIRRVTDVQTVSRADYGMSAKVTRLILDKEWLDPTRLESPALLTDIRGITIYAQSEELALAEQPLTDDISGDTVELDDLYDGLQSGRWAIVSGERTDIPNTSGVTASELVMLSSVTQDVRPLSAPQPPGPTGTSTTNALSALAGGSFKSPASASPTAAASQETTDPPPPDTVPPATLPGDKTHTALHFETKLAYTYKRDTVTIAGNVVDATNGETQNEVLGSGDSSKSMQRFALRKSPLTYLSALTPSGAASTLEVRVNDILWHETDNLDATGPKDRIYITQTNDQTKTSIIFGNGATHGARPPTGAENIKAVYRVGIGKPGNVDAGQISLLATRPLGVKSVVNPLPATGGADAENRDQARRNVPLATMSLDRIVSVQDYADFARTYAGIGKASAASLSNGRQQLVHLTIAGTDNIPIAKTSDLYRYLFQTLRQFGNPSTPLRVDITEVKLLVISAQVRILPDYQLESVTPNIRAALYNAFGFEQRELGQTVYQSEVLSVIQGVAGVGYVDLAILDAVDQQNLLTALDTIHAEELKEANTGQQPDPTHDLQTLLGLGVQQYVVAELAKPDPNANGGIDPAQLVFLSPDVPDTLILTELNS
jgi:hypothetical protein